MSILHVGRGWRWRCARRRKKRGEGGGDGLCKEFRGNDGDDGETERGGCRVKEMGPSKAGVKGFVRG